jgi:hypothetical protein
LRIIIFSTLSSHGPDISRLIAVFMRFLRSVRGTTAGKNKKKRQN